ncbi:FAD binding domain protein [Polyplosphaeria fusca]|uniref:FAD binding domain protein n=1 Tax=Polyplosphaeria fusca TaxID=682080 RepID=A0A9P4RAG4_9PLEO|nr:FAD binding domain protein [Polyplosphaeria fusca]
MAIDFSEPGEFDARKALAERGVEVQELPDIQSSGSVSATAEYCDAVVDKLKSVYPKQVTLQGTPEHDTWRSQLWSAFQSDAIPACVFQPHSAEEVAIAVLLCRWGRCKFAVKSGGHSAMKDSSNSDGGITLDLRNLRSIELSQDKEVVKLGTGTQWVEVYDELKKDGLAVIGGRHADLGIGGFTLGGGISFFASIYGWGCDRVTAFELVTATGEILNVTHQSYPDLYWALRGGGPNFGIVTRFDLETIPQGDLYGGSLVYSYAQHGPAVISAFCKLGHDDADPKAATWLAGFFNPQMGPGLSMLTLYKDPNSEADVFSEIRAIPPLSNAATVRSLTDITLMIKKSSPIGLREMYWTNTFKLDESFCNWFMDMFLEELEADPKKGAYEGYLPAPVFQIMTRESVKHMARNGGNCLPLKEEDAPYMNLNYSCMWKNEADNEDIISLIARIMGKAVQEGKRRGVFVDYIYMNYASEYQDVMGSYGENFDKLKKIATKYDPKGIYQNLMSGYFKFKGAPKKEGPGIWKAS